MLKMMLPGLFEMDLHKENFLKLLLEEIVLMYIKMRKRRAVPKKKSKLEIILIVCKHKIKSIKFQ